MKGTRGEEIQQNPTRRKSSTSNARRRSSNSNASDPARSAAAVDALGFDEDGDPPLRGHDPVVLVEVFVRSTGGGEDLAEGERLSFAVDPLERIVGPGDAG